MYISLLGGEDDRSFQHRYIGPSATQRRFAPIKIGDAAMKLKHSTD